MPSIEQNRSNWDNPRNWLRDGEEWSASWGSSAGMWFGSILPRLAAFLPTGHLLEIACGHGRVTEYLLGHCQRYTGVDLAPSCVAFCRQRFVERSSASFHETDGRSLEVVADSSIDFAFSWDSLVHAERDALAGYVQALARKLRPGGGCFVHHSNLGAYVNATGELSIPNPHWRATSVSAAIVQELAQEHGLQCIAQELVQWGMPQHNDCFTLLRRPEAGDAPVSPQLWYHPAFSAELNHFRQLGMLYRSPRPETGHG
jgi:SAM-dependent methyltransferase